MTAAQKYLNEIIDYGGEPYTRGEAILHMRSLGVEKACIDRWLQDYELGQRWRERREAVAIRVFLEGPRRRTRKLCR